jgi:tetratricopeptide (TPR) repeat protein
MRLRTLNRLSQVSSAVVTALLLTAGCTPHPSATSRSPLAVNAMAHPTTMAVGRKPTAAAAAVKSGATVKQAQTIVKSTPIKPAPVTQPMAVAIAAPPATASATQASTEPATEPAVPPTSDATPPTDPHQIEADAALAESFASMAELEFETKVTQSDMWPWIWRHQAALLSASATLDPTTARFPRLIADANAEVHDYQGEMDALKLAIVADPADEFSWNRRLDLILAPMQTATQKINYLRDVVGRDSGDIIVPADVRAHAGYLLARILLERGEEDSATVALAEALRTCPASVECLKLRYAMLAPNAPRFERCEQLLDLLRANPLQSRYSLELANLVAQSGLVQESLPWYQLAVATAHHQGDRAESAMLDWAVELYIGDEKLDSLRLTAVLLQIDPTFTPAYFLQLILTRSTGDKETFAKSLQQATNALSNRVVEACNAAAPAGAYKATTRPIDEQAPLTLPDLSTTLDQIKKGVSPQVKQQFVEAVADLALLEGYFAEQPDTATQLVDALSKVVPDDAPELARLRGWNDLLARKTDDAKAKFTAVATKDPLAELGLIKIMLDNPADRPTAESMGRRLLQEHPSGLIGALLWEQLNSEHVRLITTTQADALRDALAQFPAALQTAVDNPKNLYAIHVTPHDVGSHCGDPVLADVSVQNLSDYDLTIGSDGLLKRELLFSITPKLGDKPSTFSAFDNIAGPTVLASHTQLTQTVRVDQTQLLAFLDTQSGQQFAISGSLSTNQAVGSLGGYVVQFVKDFFRLSSAFTPANAQEALQNLTDGRPEQKITALNTLERFIRELEQQKNPKPEMQQEVVGLVSAVHHARVDPLSAVAAWACKAEYDVVGTKDRAEIVRDLANSPDWRHRQIALLVINGVDPALRDQLVDQLSTDSQSSVRAEAINVKGFLALPPATQPASEPTTAP